MLHQLQRKEQKLLEDVGELNRQLDTSMADSRRQTDELRERNAAKERANLSRVTDLESQLTRCNSQVGHLKKNKEEVGIETIIIIYLNINFYCHQRLNED